MSIPKEPRQMMINMMYLVLTALLAMNVSSEILNAFHTVNTGIVNSNSSVDLKTSSILAAFEKEVANDPKKATQWRDKAVQVHAETKKLVDYIESLKTEVIKASDGWTDKKGVKHPDGANWDEKIGILNNHSNLDATTYLFLETKDAPRAAILEKKINDTKATLLSILGSPDKEDIQNSIPLRIDQPPVNDEGEQKTWAEANFHMVPTIATVTLLNKYINDAKNSEGIIMERLRSKIGVDDFKANTLVAKVIAPSSYVLEGQQYKADIFVAAYNSTQDPVVYQGGLSGAAHKDRDGNYDVVEGTNPVVGATPIKTVAGMGRYETGASGDAEHTLTGAVMVKVNGIEKYYPFETKWQSAKAAVVISPTKMNVFYIGVPNPVDISIPGVPSDRIQPSITQGSLSPDPQKKGSYIVNVTTQGNADINVSAKLGDVNKPMGKMTFRVKRIPDPIGQLGNLPGGRASASAVRGQGYVLANLANFDFDARFNVISFSMTYYRKRADPLSDVSNATALTAKMADWLSKAKPGDALYIDDIKVLGPDKSVRKLPSVAYQIN